MKRFVILACILGVFPASEAFAGGGLFWFHTRPKSVLLNDDSSHSVQNRVAWHGNAFYSGSGRLYFQDSGDRRWQTNQQSKSRLMSVFSRGWLTGAGASKSAPAKNTPAK